MDKIKKILFWGSIILTSYNYIPQIMLCILSFLCVLDFLYSKKKVNFKEITVIIFYMSIVTYYNYVFNNRNIGIEELIRVIAVFFLPFVGTYMYLVKNYDNFLAGYYKVIYGVSIIGIIQIIGGILNIKSLYNFKYLGIRLVNIDFITEKIIRVYSIYTEPSILAVYFIPIIYIIIYNYICKRKRPNLKDKIILICYFFTFSTVAYFNILGMIILIVLINIPKKRQLKYIITIIVMGTIIYEYVPTVKDKIYYLFINTSIYKSGTVFSFYSNYLIVKQSLLDNIFISRGIYGYYEIYMKYINLLFEKTYRNLYLNANDGGNMLFRMIIEYGILGIIILLFYIFKSFLLNKKDLNFQIFFSALIFYGVRNGVYDNNIFLIYISMFIITNWRLKNEKKNFINNT